MEENIRQMLMREDDKYRPYLENRVACQHERDNSILTAWRHRERKINIFCIVGEEKTRRRGKGTAHVRVLDVGCQYGTNIKGTSRVLVHGGEAVPTSSLNNSLFKALSAFFNMLAIGLLERKHFEGGTKDSPDIRKEDKHEHVLGHMSEMNLSGYLAAGSEFGLDPVEIIPASVFSGSMYFDMHPFLPACLVIIEAVHRVFRFTSWALGIQMVLMKK